MSGIVGVWNLDGRPLDEAVLSGMSASIRHRGPDGQSRRVAGSIGFAHQRMWVTPEDTGEVQPLAGRAGIMLAMDGRIDNRDELLRALDLPKSVSDAACVLGAYEAWGERCAERLNGDFAFAIFDAPKQQLMLVRDSIGIRPLHYYHHDRLFAFASEIKALLEHPDIPARPDDEGIADFLLVSARPVDRQEVTCFAGISSLVPAHLAIVTPARMTTRRYWDFETGRAITMRSFDEYAEAFREHFAEAVRRRARSARPVAISVSGGLDSSSIFCQAVKLERAGKANGATVAGISHVGAEGTDADERKYLVEIEREYGIEIEQFPLEPLQGVVEGADDQIRAIEAPLVDHMWGVTRELHSRAAARGARVLLTGHWGDQVLFSSAYLVDLFDRLDWGEIRRHARQYTRWLGPMESRVLMRRFVMDVVRHAVPRAMLPSLKWIRRRVLGGGARPKPWFSDRFLQQGLRLANRPSTLGEGFHSEQARALYLQARLKYHVHCMEWQNKVGAWHGLDAAFPFLDRDLLGFLIAIPGDVQNRHGVPRAILREAMQGILPEAIRTRCGKADFTGIVNAGVEQDFGVISGALSHEAFAVRFGYLDADRLVPEVARVSTRLGEADCGDSWDVADIFGLELWLQVFLPSIRRVSDEPEEARARAADKATV